VIAILATAGVVITLIAATLRTDRRHAMKTAAALTELRAMLAKTHVYEVRAHEPGAAIPAGLEHASYLGVVSRSGGHRFRCFVDERRTTVAMVADQGLYLFSATADHVYETMTYPKVWWAPAFMHRLCLPTKTAPAAALVSHGKHVSKVVGTLTRIESIEHVAELQTQLSRRFVAERASRGADQLLDDDLRAFLGHRYDWFAPGVMSALGSGLPRAKVVP
jgi:hypothetical protein